jgi:hypothetical protein
MFVFNIFGKKLNAIYYLQLLIGNWGDISYFMTMYRLINGQAVPLVDNGPVV